MNNLALDVDQYGSPACPARASRWPSSHCTVSEANAREGEIAARLSPSAPARDCFWRCRGCKLGWDSVAEERLVAVQRAQRPVEDSLILEGFASGA